MPQVIITPTATKGLERCRLFLANKNPQAAKRASQTIKRHIMLLKADPDIGRLLGDDSPLRELIIDFGDSGYIALYRHDVNAERVYILSFKHQKELKYQ